MANSHPGSYCGQDAYSDMFIIGGGTELETVVRRLTPTECERLQGYLFGKAMPLKEILIKIGAGTLKVSEEFLNND